MSCGPSTRLSREGASEQEMFDDLDDGEEGALYCEAVTVASSTMPSKSMTTMVADVMVSCVGSEW